VSQGWALAYRQYSTAYIDQEDAARTANLGIWRGTFTAP
jgi:endonuclease YncB( thermonuclease family)